MTEMARLILKKGRDKSVRAFHPWIFSGAIESVDDFHQAGDLVRVLDHSGNFLGIGYLNPKSQIAVRILTFLDERIDLAFFKKRIERAQALRSQFVPENTNCYRLIHAEGDFLPGLIVDRYGSFLVAQFLSFGMERLKPMIIEVLRSLPNVQGVFERSDTSSRELEGLERTIGVLCGEEPPEWIKVEEHGLSFLVDVRRGQKTGFFLDQSENRKLTGQLASGKRVLNCFSYTGGFSVYAAKGGAVSVTSVEIAKEALALSKKNFELNGLAGEQYEFVCDDVFEFLRKGKECYDFIILDPPAFCKNRSQIFKASRGYKDINLCALRKLKERGLLLTFSCSSFIDRDLFRKIFFAAAKDARRDLQILNELSHGADHPQSVFHPEGKYLKGALCRIS